MGLNNSVYYQNKANSAKGHISNASSCLLDANRQLNSVLSIIGDNVGKQIDALRKNSYDSISRIKNKITVCNNFYNLNNSITNNAISMDRKISDDFTE